jgi:hypothetical protein
MNLDEEAAIQPWQSSRSQEDEEEAKPSESFYAPPAQGEVRCSGGGCERLEEVMATGILEATYSEKEAMDHLHDVAASSQPPFQEIPSKSTKWGTPAMAALNRKGNKSRNREAQGYRRLLVIQNGPVSHSRGPPSRVPPRRGTRTLRWSGDLKSRYHR